MPVHAASQLFCNESSLAPSPTEELSRRQLGGSSSGSSRSAEENEAALAMLDLKGVHFAFGQQAPAALHFAFRSS